MRVYDVERILFDFAPPELAEEWDNVGLIAGFSADCVKGILIALDVSFSIIDEAVERGCNLIISHHPTLFHAEKKISDEGGYSSELVAYALKKEVNLIACHTNFDRCEGGINDTLASLFGGFNIEPTSEGDIGRYFEVAPVTLRELAVRISELIDDSRVAYIGNGDSYVTGCYVIGGAGCDEATIRTATEEGLVLITGEIKHHLAVMAKDVNCKIISFGHFTSEKIFGRIVKGLLDCKLTEIADSISAVYLSEKESNPFNGIRE